MCAPRATRVGGRGTRTELHFNFDPGSLASIFFLCALSSSQNKFGIKPQLLYRKTSILMFGRFLAPFPSLSRVTCGSRSLPLSNVPLRSQHRFSSPLQQSLKRLNSTQQSLKRLNSTIASCGGAEVKPLWAKYPLTSATALLGLIIILKVRIIRHTPTTLLPTSHPTPHPPHTTLPHRQLAVQRSSMSTGLS
jgi:hypothetical protein